MISPIPRLDAAAERDLLADVVAAEPELVLVMSDLHLGHGCDPVTGTTVSVENFLSDGAFARFLEHFQPRARSALVILNGDIFDFLRVTRIPHTNTELQEWADRLARLDLPDRARSVDAAVSRSERTYGLRTNDYKTLWKLIVIARGHPGFFEALARWVSAGGTVAINRGNHDPELYWPLVRQAIRDELVLSGATREAAMRVAFIDESLVLQNLYIEHGHMYEEMTRIDGPPVLPDGEQINLPLGSFVNRYFINRIELLNPFIDNIKPINNALLALLRRYPLSIFGTYARAWRFLWKAIQSRRMLNASVLTIAIGLFVPIITVALVIAIKVSPELSGWLAVVMPWFDGVRAKFAAALGILFPVVLPYLLGLLTQVWRELLRVTGLKKPERDPYAMGAAASMRAAVPKRFARTFAVLGHTHVQQVMLLQSTPREELYVNTGTWIALWPDDRPDLMGRVVRSFSKFERTPEGYVHHAMEWEDCAEEPRAAVILSFANSDN